MVRKKDPSLEKLTSHVVDWWLDRIYEQREVIDMVIKDDGIPLDHKEMILSDIAVNLEALLQLLDPIAHEEDDLVDWAVDFIDEYALPEKPDEPEN